MFINGAVDTSYRHLVIWPVTILNVSFPAFLLHSQLVIFLLRFVLLPTK